MPTRAPKLPPDCPQAAPSGTAPKTALLKHEGRNFSLVLEPRRGWRIRSRSKSFPVDFRTGTTNLSEAKARAKEFLEKNASGWKPGRGGGSLEDLARLYLETPKRTKGNVAKDNVSRLRTVCRVALGKELSAVTCREVGPDLWQRYQRAALEAEGLRFDLATRYRQNIAVNSAVRVARCLFLPALVRVYRAAGLDCRTEAGEAVMLPEPYLPPSKVDDAALVEAWRALESSEPALWLVVGLARFAGLRREEISALRAGWVEVDGALVRIALRDRPEEKWWTKTGKPYRAEVVEAGLARHLAAFAAVSPADALLVTAPGTVERSRWFERAPQKWLHAHGVGALKPLHRLRGLYADQVATLTRDAIAARLAGIRAAQESLGHTSSAVTEAHYLTPDAE